MWSSDVPENLANAGLQGVMDVVTASRQDRRVISLGSAPFANGPYSSGDWYAQTALQRSQYRERGYGPQINTHNVMELFYNEPWQAAPHWEVFIVNTDLTTGDPSNNFVFGATHPEFPASIQSVTRIEYGPRFYDVSKEQLVRRLLRHEVGHMFDLPDASRGHNLEQRLGTHCTNVCTMRQGMSIDEWAQQYRQERASRIQFCHNCQDDLAANRSRYVPSPRRR